MGLKYEDYVKRQEANDPIQQEIDDAAKQTETRRNIPESVQKRFDGKSVDEVLESYANLERKLSEQGETIGKLRKTADQLIELQLQAPQKPAGEVTDNPDEEPITVDSFYDDPDGVVTKKVDKATKAQREELDKELAALRAARIESTLTELHPNWKKDIQTNEFADWVGESQWRQRLLQAGHAYDYDAAHDLLSMWEDHKNRSQELEQQRKRDRQLDAATLETSSPEGFEPEATFSRTKVLNAKIRAKQGSRADEEWLRANSAAINLAYAEGRITD